MFESLAEKLKRKAKADQPAETDIQFKTLVEPEAPALAPVPEAEEKRAAAPIVAGAGDAESNIELKLVRPERYEEVSTVADYLLEGCTVVLNLELLDEDTANSMLQFLNGVAYAIDGEINDVSATTVIITPTGVDVSDVT